MAYSQYEENAAANPVKYYAEDYDYPTYYQTVPDIKHTNQQADTSLTNKRFKNNLPTVGYINEKCPIYVHRYDKYPVYDGSFQKSVDKNREATNPKTVLDKLEETYWATWKPKKEDVKPVKVKNKPKNKPLGDHGDEIIKYFSAKNFGASSASVVDKNEEENAKKHVKKSSKSLEQRRKRREKEADSWISQEIQTDLPLILPRIDENIEKTEPIREQSENTPTDRQELGLENAKAKSGEELSSEKHLQEEPPITGIKHTDSFILTKKKQETTEEKTHFQQPRSIRLFKKPGTTSSSYIKGGSYPLKSCLKKDTPLLRGNFRLGSPGSSLFVTTSSYNKKHKR